MIDKSKCGFSSEKRKIKFDTSSQVLIVLLSIYMYPYHKVRGSTGKDMRYLKEISTSACSFLSCKYCMHIHECMHGAHVAIVILMRRC